MKLSEFNIFTLLKRKGPVINPTQDFVGEDPDAQKIAQIENEAKQQQQKIQKQKQAPVIEESLEDIAKKKIQKIEKGRKIFNSIMLVVKILLLVLAAVAAGYFFLKKDPEEIVPGYNTTNNTEPKPVEQPQEWTLHKDEGLKIFVQYPPESSLIKYDDPINKLEIIYEKSTEDFTTVTEKNLKQGYIFRVTPFNLSIRDLDKTAAIKRDSFLKRCPAGFTVTDVQGTLVDTIDSRTFEVFDCDADYRVTYTPRFGIYYEILQIYKGDVGIKQQYKSKTDEIFLSYRFFSEETPPPDPYTTFIDQKVGYQITHPNLDSSCCDIESPPAVDGIYIRHSLSLYDKDTYVDEKTFDGIQIYFIDYQDRYESFDDLIRRQKETFTEDYKIATSTDPNFNEYNIKVGNYGARRIDGISWKGNDFIYVDYIFENKFKRALVLVIKNTSGEEFKVIVQGIIDSFENYSE